MDDLTKPVTDAEMIALLVAMVIPLLESRGATEAAKRLGKAYVHWRDNRR